MRHERANPTNEGALILLSDVLSPFELVLLGRGVGRKRRGSGKAATVLKLWAEMRPPFSCPCWQGADVRRVFTPHWCQLGPGCSRFKTGLFKSERLLRTAVRPFFTHPALAPSLGQVSVLDLNI